MSFKLDPRLTTGLYLGERWVSPNTYTQLQDGSRLVVTARASGAGWEGQGAPTWTSEDPEIVSVSPGEGDQVEITVHREGETALAVTAGAVSLDLSVRSVSEQGVLRVDLSQ